MCAINVDIFIDAGVTLDDHMFFNYTFSPPPLKINIIYLEHILFG